MENTTLLKPTLHFEVLLKDKASSEVSQQIAIDIRKCLSGRYRSLLVNGIVSGYGLSCSARKEHRIFADST